MRKSHTSKKKQKNMGSFMPCAQSTEQKSFIDTYQAWNMVIFVPSWPIANLSPQQKPFLKTPQQNSSFLWNFWLVSDHCVDKVIFDSPPLFPSWTFDYILFLWVWETGFFLIVVGPLINRHKNKAPHKKKKRKKKKIPQNNKNSFCSYSNLVSFLLRCGTRPYKWGI